MKTAIIYYSKHHGNTKKLLDAIAEKNDVTLIDVVQHPQADLKNDDRIGLASGIYYSKFHRSLLKAAEGQARFLPLYLRRGKEGLHGRGHGSRAEAEREGARRIRLPRLRYLWAIQADRRSGQGASYERRAGRRGALLPIASGGSIRVSKYRTEGFLI